MMNDHKIYEIFTKNVVVFLFFVIYIYIYIFFFYQFYFDFLIIFPKYII